MCRDILVLVQNSSHDCGRLDPDPDAGGHPGLAPCPASSDNTGINPARASSPSAIPSGRSSGSASDDNSSDPNPYDVDPNPMTLTPTPVQPSSTPGGVACAAPNPSNIPTGSYLGKCCNCGMGTDPGTGYDPTALTCDCQTPFNTVSHTTKGIAFCAGKDIYVDQNGRLNC